MHLPDAFDDRCYKLSTTNTKRGNSSIETTNGHQAYQGEFQMTGNNGGFPPIFSIDASNIFSAKGVSGMGLYLPELSQVSLSQQLAVHCAQGGTSFSSSHV